jgi:hypothetical protein
MANIWSEKTELLKDAFDRLAAPLTGFLAERPVPLPRRTAGKVSPRCSLISVDFISKISVNLSQFRSVF